VFRERRREKKGAQGETTGQFVQRDISFRFLGKSGRWMGQHHIFTLISSVILTAFLIWSGLKIGFDHNYMNMEARGLTSVALQDTVMEKFDLSMDYAMLLADDPQQSRQLADQCKDRGTVALTEDISLYLPSTNQQQKRISHIRDIRQNMESAAINGSISPGEISTLIDEIDRLQMNVIEIQDLAFLGGQDKVDNKCKQIVGTPLDSTSRNLFRELLEVMEGDNRLTTIGIADFQQTFAPYFRTSVLRMTSTDPLRLNVLPTSILDQYSNQDRNQFLVTAFPAGNIWQDAQFLSRFVDDLERVSEQATGMPPIFLALIQIIGRDGRNAMLLTLVLVFLLLWLDFRKPLHALMAMIPLAVGAFWMVGLMYLTGMQLTVMNVMGLPMILGIGIDDGVHIMHRWRQEGEGNIYTIFSSTGKAIFLTSLTTMLAFGSLVFSIWRGFAQLGGALFLGVAACFLTTVIILPGIIGWIERNKK
ncbi:MAG TPA: MMPL family transporter, partial [bacterium]|nr:MMPL family transporter [bacterium]